MVQTLLQPPRAPPDHLRLLSFQILSRLALIRPFRPWLDGTQYYVHRRNRNTPLELLYDCLTFGAPLGTLLSLLGSPIPPPNKAYGHLKWHVDDFDWDISIDERREYFECFLGRVHVLEMLRHLPYGEVLRIEDFLSGEAQGFAKVLRTVYRLLFALQESYPGIFHTPSNHDDQQRRRELMHELIETEKAHLSLFKAVSDAAAALSAGMKIIQPCLECFLVHREYLVQYHEQLLKSLQEVSSRDNRTVYWDRMFCLDNDVIRSRISSGYRLLCINYLGLVETLEASRLEPSLVDNAKIVERHLSILIGRMSDLKNILQDILDCTIPAEDQNYNSLCEAVFRIGDLAETMDEIGSEILTMRAISILKSRALMWTAPDPEDLGLLILDDCLPVHPKKELEYSVFLFESYLLCCSEGKDRLALGLFPTVYPIRPWEMGPALKKRSPLDIVHAIPTEALQSVSSIDMSSIEISWVDVKKESPIQTMIFYPTSLQQWDQWIFLLQPFVPPIYRPLTTRHEAKRESEEVLSEDEDEYGNTIVHPKPWSLVARKGPRSDASSFVNVEQPQTQDFSLSPGLLPTLFCLDVDIPLQCLSPQGETDLVLSNDRSPTPTSDDEFEYITNSTILPDLTGAIVCQERYPSAHGGFSDVWKGIWKDGTAEHKVAVKVLRSKSGDLKTEERMVKRLQRELSIWKNLDHPHVLKLYGTTADFGRYSSMVCPWMECGNVSKHMEKCSDILSTVERFRLLSEIADGLAYLHSRSVIHGDLTGSNILLDNEGTVCLCDFGLSLIAAEFEGAAFQTTTIGGAVRWADSLFYRDHDDGQAPRLCRENDIYSFGSVMLEVLSGRIPYHYIRTDAQVVIELSKGVKPRRPAQTFVSDAQWMFIQQCWADDISQRPDIVEVLRVVEAFYMVAGR